MCVVICEPWRKKKKNKIIMYMYLPRSWGRTGEEDGANGD
jgi:hypothetical protein